MNREAMKQLRLDRRLINRRGWISTTDLEQELDSLPDVSDKIAPEEDEDERPAQTAAADVSARPIDE